ncbi:hypothetical protein [Halobacterium sp. KA-6]|uniref:hypothetical protein n=1 Tax=Halobacterium sp. KA-6 TaxID=2896368 RepID=UPI001E63AE05|nr:hypothetical protein [Halobacterium sp. KA-6]MCD2204391.1 hypothetical protein [Halobacterium sp. KA-6]
MAAVQSSSDVLEKRDADALTEPMTVLDDIGRARDAPDLYVVVSSSGASYLVDHREGRCECADSFYRGTTCKHQRRVQFATGQRDIPGWVQEDRVDDQLGDYIQGGRA